MNEKQIQIRPCFYDIRCHDHLSHIKVNYDKMDVASECIMLPSYPELRMEEQEYIVSCLKEFLLLTKK